MIFSEVLQAVVKPKEYCSRTFVTFTEEQTFDDIFNKPQPKVPAKQLCPITRLPAKYFDPITKTPYANAQAFKLLRHAYHQQCDSVGKDKKS